MKECPACRRCFPDDVNHCPHDGDAAVSSIAGEPMLDGRYMLERRIGHGGMGVVFQARHIFLKTAHAIKVILPDLVGNDPALVTRFRQEALAAAAIRHQNIIAVTDFGVARGTMPFLVMEFVKGKSLHDILAAEGALPTARVLEIVAAIGAGVGAAHRQKIVHRDLKPLNIMLQDDLPVSEGLKILDFGLAKIKSGELLGSFVQAQTSGLMGSPFYMAPEQWSDEEPDGRADIYSLGIILYQMLGGDVPFKGTSVPSIMKKHLTSEPPPISSLGVNVAPQIEAVVRHALEKEPARRPPTVEALIHELRDAVATTSAGHKRPDLGPIGLESDTIFAPSARTGTIPLPERPKAALRVHTSQPQSTVFIDNKSVGITDRSGNLIVPDVSSGKHRVRIVSDGYAEWESQIECDSGECRVDAQLESLKGGPPPRPSGDLLDKTVAGVIPAPQQTAAYLESQRRAQEQREHEARDRFAREELAREAEARRRTEERQRAEEERLDKERQQRDELERVARQTKELEEKVARLTAGNITAQPSAFNPASTHPHHSGVSTQPVGENSLPGAEQQQVTMVQDRQVFQGSAPNITVPASRKSPLLLISIVAVVVLALGGGTTAYFVFKPGTTSQHQSGNNGGSTTENSNNSNKVGKTELKPELIPIPGGTFQMGRNNGLVQEGPAHNAAVQPFTIDKTEVTNAEYADFVRETKYKPPTDWIEGKPPAGQEFFPVANVSVDDAKAFAAWRSKRDGVTYRLPTEEEWEYAARGGDQGNLYSWGNNWVEGRANVGTAAASAVGSYPEDKTRWGVLDMMGNVYEWTSSKASLYPGNPAKIPAGYENYIIIRGGSYITDLKVRRISATFRDWVQPSTKNQSLGFRLVHSGT